MSHPTQMLLNMGVNVFAVDLLVEGVKPEEVDGGEPVDLRRCAVASRSWSPARLTLPPTRRPEARAR